MLLEAIETYGVESGIATLQRHVCLCALRQRGTADHLRPRPDRKKAALYRCVPKRRRFGSELKSIKAHPAFQSAEVDRDALTAFSFGMATWPTPLFDLSRIFKLPHGSW